MDNLSKIKALLDEKGNAVHAMRSAQDVASENKRELTHEERQTVEQSNERITAIDAEVKSLLTAAEDEQMRARFDALMGNAANGNAGDEKRNKDLETLDKLRNGEIRSAEFMPSENEVRTLLAGTATDGAELVPETLFGELQRHLVESSPILSSGVRILRTSGGEDLVIPKTTSYSAASIVGEAAQISPSDPQFTTVTMNAYKYAFLSAISSELMTDAMFNVAGFLAQQGGEALGRGVDAHLASGSGSGQPNGIDNATVGVTAAATTAVDPDELIDMVHSVIPQYRTGAVWYMNDEVFSYLRKLKYSDGTGATNQYLWQPGLTAGAPDTLLGYPIFIEPNMTGLTSGALVADQDVAVFGRPSSYWARLVGGVRIERSNDFNFDYDVSTWRFIMRADGEIVDTNGLRKLKTAAA